MSWIRPSSACKQYLDVVLFIPHWYGWTWTSKDIRVAGVLIYWLSIPMATKPLSTSTTTTNKCFCFSTHNVLCSFANSPWLLSFIWRNLKTKFQSIRQSSIFLSYTYNLLRNNLSGCFRSGCQQSCVYIKGCSLFTYIFRATRCLIHCFFPPCACRWSMGLKQKVPPLQVWLY